MFGLGRDDDRRYALGLGQTLLAGVRAARTQAVGAIRLRLEVVQWAPLGGRGHGGTAGAPAPGPSPVESSSPRPLRDWGGTILRCAVSTS